MDKPTSPGRRRHHRKRRFHVPRQARGIDYENFDVPLSSPESSVAVALVSALTDVAPASVEEMPPSVEEEAAAEIAKERKLRRSRTLKILGLLVLILACVRFDLVFRLYLVVMSHWHNLTKG